MRVWILYAVVVGVLGFVTLGPVSGQSVKSGTGLERATLIQQTATGTSPRVDFASPQAGLYWEVLAGTINSTAFDYPHTEVVVLVDDATGAEIFHSVHLFGGGSSNIYSAHDNHLTSSMGSDRTVIVPPGWHLAVWHVSTAATVPYTLRIRLMVIERSLDERPL